MSRATMIDASIQAARLNGLQLTSEAQNDRDSFESDYGVYGNCSCHISPPCGSCTHPGNPLNQDEEESCWENMS